MKHIKYLCKKDSNDGLDVIESRHLHHLLDTIRYTRGWGPVIFPILPRLVERNLDEGGSHQLVSRGLNVWVSSPEIRASLFISKNFTLLKKALIHPSPELVATAIFALSHSTKKFKEVIYSSLGYALFKRKEENIKKGLLANMKRKKIEIPKTLRKLIS
jgi:hypothetical protein